MIGETELSKYSDKLLYGTMLIARNDKVIVDFDYGKLREEMELFLRRCDNEVSINEEDNI